jgi:hypothetical protein
MPVASAAAGAAGGEGEVPGVARGAEDRVHGVGAERELGRIGFADHDRPGRPQALDDQRVLVGHVALEELGAVRGADALRRRDVLDGDGDAEQRRKIGAAAEGGGREARVPQRVLAHQGDDRVHVGVHRVDPREDGVQDFERRDTPSPIELEQFDGGCEAEVAGGHARTVYTVRSGARRRRSPVPPVRPTRTIGPARSS